MSTPRRSHPAAPLYYPGSSARLNADQIAGAFELSFTQLNDTISDAQTPASVVTQHQAALAIAWAQLTGVPLTFPPEAHSHDDLYFTEAEIAALFAALAPGDLLGWPADSAGVLTNDGAGNLSWAAAGAGTIDGSGTAGKLAKWSDADTLADSLLSEAGTLVSVAGNLSLDQGAEDSAILKFISSDVAHGITDFEPTDVYGSILKSSPASGGLHFRGLTAGSNAFAMTGYAGTANATKTSAGVGSVSFNATLKSGTGSVSLGANGNILSLRDDGVTKFLFDSSSRFDIIGAGSIYINAVQVLSTQGAAIANAAASTASNTTTINAVLARLRAHGIIAT